MPVKLFTPSDYDGVIQGLLGDSIDMAWLGASAYAKTHLNDPDAVEPIMVKTNTDGSYGYYSVMFARKDSGIRTLEDLEGKTFAFNDPNSTSGYLIPSIEIPQELGEPMDEYFGEVKFTGGHEQSVVAVSNGDVDASVTWADGIGAWADGYNSGALRKAADAGIVNMNNLVEIWKSKPIPEGPIVLRTELPERCEGGHRHADCVAALHGRRLRLQLHGRRGARFPADRRMRPTPRSSRRANPRCKPAADLEPGPIAGPGFS